MFPGYDPEKKPPYTQLVYEEIDGVRYVTKYIVSNGYGGSISISHSTRKLLEEGSGDEEEVFDRE